MARTARQGGPALRVVIADGHGAYDVVTPVAGIERRSGCCRTSPGEVGAPGADAVYAGNGGDHRKRDMIGSDG